ncbi:hypothetical protein ACFLYD_07540 [Chloroflexota bacterium]
MDQHAVPTTTSALARYNPFVKEAEHSVIPLYPFTLTNKELSVSTLAPRFLFPQRLPMLSRETENASFGAAFRALAEYPAFEVTLARASVVFDG